MTMMMPSIGPEKALKKSVCRMLFEVCIFFQEKRLTPV